MSIKYMKEREESLLQMLGYKKFTHDQDGLLPQLNKVHSTGNLLVNLNKGINKKEITQKYQKTPYQENNKHYNKVLKTEPDPSPTKKYYLDQFYNTHRSNNSINFVDKNFNSEIPLLGQKNKKTPQKNINGNQQSTSTNFSTNQINSTIQNTTYDYSFQKDYMNKNPIIEEIFYQQALMNRISTPHLTQQANNFSRSRKDLLLQLNLNSFQQDILKKKLQAITESQINQTPTKFKNNFENSRSMNQIFKDQKLDVIEISSSLQKAKMLTPQQLEKNSNFSVNEFISPRITEKQKTQKNNLSESKIHQTSQFTQSIFKKNKHQNISINNQYVNEDMDFVNEQVDPNQNRLLERRIHSKQTQNQLGQQNQTSLTTPLSNLSQKNSISQSQDQIQQEYPSQLNQQQQQSSQKSHQPYFQLQQLEQQSQQQLIQQQQHQSSQQTVRLKNTSDPQQNQQNKWKFNSPVQHPQISTQNPEHFVLNEQKQVNQQQLQQQPSIGAQLQRINTIKLDYIQSNSSLTNSSKNIFIPDTVNQIQLNSTHRIQFDKDNLPQKVGLSKATKFAGVFDENNNKKRQQYQKYKTSTLYNIQHANGNESEQFSTQSIDKKHKKGNMDSKATLNTFDIVEQFTQKQLGGQKQLQSSVEIRLGGNQGIQNKLHLNLSRNTSPPKNNNSNNQFENLTLQTTKRSSKLAMTSPKLNSPSKIPYSQQQVHEDNYILIHQQLIDGLGENEILNQYIEQSGYSIEIFAFYMMKLYNYCIENSNFRQNNNNQNNNNNEDFEKSAKRSQEFPTLKVNEQTLIAILDIFCEKMQNLQVPSAQIRIFKDKFQNTIKQFMPQTLIEDLGGLEKIKLVITKLLEYLCYESGIISTFDTNLINQISDGTLCLLRSDLQQLEPYLNKLKSSSIEISNAEFYQVKISLSKVMSQLYFPENQIAQIVQRINKQLGYFFFFFDYSKDQSFKNNFILAISKNKKIIGYFLDPSQSTIYNFYDMLFATVNGSLRYIDLIDYFEHKLKTAETPLIMLEEIQKTIIETLYQTSFDSLLIRRDIQIKMERIKQKAGLVSYSYLKLGMKVDDFVSQLIEWCEYALININLPDGVQEDSIIQPEFLKEYLFLVLSEEEQLFSIFDLEYAIKYHNISNFEYCFSLWLNGIEEILSRTAEYPKDSIPMLIKYLRFNSTLIN